MRTFKLELYPITTPQNVTISIKEVLYLLTTLNICVSITDYGTYYKFDKNYVEVYVNSNIGIICEEHSIRYCDFIELLELWIPSFSNPQFHTITEVLWYESIPPKGVLCWVWNNENNEMVTIISQYNEKDVFPFKGLCGAWLNAKPLTKEECKHYYCTTI